MIVCWATEEMEDGGYGNLLSPNGFDEEMVKVAEANGAIIKTVYSKTMDEKYPACVCKSCGAFVGDHYVTEYVYSEDKKVTVRKFDLDEDTNTTIDYYNATAESFTSETVDVEFSSFQQEFMDYIPEEGSILDLGCGSGRDSKAFIESGFEVTAVDGSKELCKIASKYIGQRVINKYFQDYNPRKEFDGIWACASLLHLNHSDLYSVLSTMARKLKTGGCFYLSFKYGDFSGIRNGRYFTDMTEELIEEIVNRIPSMRIVETRITADVRTNRQDERWLNVFLIKE